MEVFLFTLCGGILGSVISTYIIRQIDKVIKTHKNNRPRHK